MPQLTAVHGIGPWTADIYLLFCLGHADAWPAGDLALQEAARLAVRAGSTADAAVTWNRWRKPGGPGAAPPPVCCGPITAGSKGAKARAPAPHTTGAGAIVMAAELDGPRLEPRAGGAARQLVVFLHGYGADGNDLIDIGRAWQQLMPHAAFVSPHAPEPCGQAPVGRQWFALTFRDPNERWIGVNKAAPVLDQFLAAELERRKLAPSALVLVGFSQGTMMALHVGLRRPTRATRHRRLFGRAGGSTRRNARDVRAGDQIATADPAGARRPRRPHPDQFAVSCQQRISRARRAGRVAHLGRHRPRHRSGGPAPRRRVHRAAHGSRAYRLSPIRATSGCRASCLSVVPVADGISLGPRFTILSRCPIDWGAAGACGKVRGALPWTCMCRQRVGRPWC